MRPIDFDTASLSSPTITIPNRSIHIHGLAVKVGHPIGCLDVWKHPYGHPIHKEHNLAAVPQEGVIVEIYSWIKPQEDSLFSATNAIRKHIGL